MSAIRLCLLESRKATLFETRPINANKLSQFRFLLARKQITFHETRKFTSGSAPHAYGIVDISIDSGWHLLCASNDYRDEEYAVQLISGNRGWRTV